MKRLTAGVLLSIVFTVAVTGPPLAFAVFAGCDAEAPIPTAEILILDPAGTGDALCLGASGPGPSRSCNCDSPSECFPNAILGSSSDGSPPISVETNPWGTIKSLYR